MLNRNGWMILAAAMAAGTVFGQNPEAGKTADALKYYKLDFVIKEVEGTKVLNARSYSMIVAASVNPGERSSIRTGAKVPVAVGQGGNQFQYMDVGVNIDCWSIKEVQRDLSLSLSAEVSSLPSEPAQPAAAGGTGPMVPPTVRQNRWSSMAIVPLKRPTLIFSSDDAASKRQMQLELLATPIGQ